MEHAPPGDLDIHRGNRRGMTVRGVSDLFRLWNNGISARKYDEHGKWMDGWESRRKRTEGHDYCVVKLGLPGSIVGFDIDTSHFTGNFPPAASIEACSIEGVPGHATEWSGIVPATSLKGNAHHFVPVSDTRA